MPLRRAGTVPSTGVRYGPGSAAHRFARRAALRRGTGAARPIATSRRLFPRWRRLFRRCRSGALGRLRHFSKAHDLDAPVGCRRRAGRIAQLFFAEPERLKALGRYLERRHQYIADRIGPPLADDQIVVAPAARFGVADDQEFVRQQCRIRERVRDASQRSIRARPDDRGIGIEQHVEGHLRQLEQFGNERRPVQWLRRRLRFGTLDGLLAYRGDIDLRRGFQPGELIHQVFRRRGGLRRARDIRAPRA